MVLLFLFHGDATAVVDDLLKYESTEWVAAVIWDNDQQISESNIRFLNANIDIHFIFLLTVMNNAC